MSRAKSSILVIVTLLLSSLLYSQNKGEKIVSSDFTIRDFCFSNNQLSYLKKWDIFLFDPQTSSYKDYFIGGYGLKMEMLPNSNTIVTVSNELVENVSSVRFFNRSSKSFERVFYNYEGKILDFLIIPEAKLFVLSLISNKIVFIDYSENQRFLKTIEIKNDTLSRTMDYKNGVLYFATDRGAVFKYNLSTYQKAKIFETKNSITQISVQGNKLYFTSINGEVGRVDLLSKEFKNIFINNDFVSTFAYAQKQLVLGTWKGDIVLLDAEKFEVEEQFKAHKKAILKIMSNEDSVYSSSIDGTIRKWTLN